MIHPTAIIEDGAQLGVDCDIQAYVVIKRHVVLGDRVSVHAFSVIGGDPQYLRFDGATVSAVRVGSGTVIREHVTINRSIYEGRATVVGENGFLMAGSHLAHDCQLGANVVVANQALLAGHVTVDDNCFVGGNAAVHQFVRVGEGTMIGGTARITRDLAPFTLVAERDEVSGLNLIGLKRRGVPREAIRELKEAFREVYYTPGNIRETARFALESGRFTSREAQVFLTFFREGKRSFARPARGGSGGEASEE